MTFFKSFFFLAVFTEIFVNVIGCLYFLENNPRTLGDRGEVYIGVDW
jgi:hypothetical protein